MANYDIQALHQRILSILLAIDEVCKEHHLRYYIWAGTQLGAVRHGGFIPWDDDIDIAMPRHDYELLIKNADQWLKKPYEFVCSERDNTYPLPFGKIQDANSTLIERMHLRYVGGVYIDVFPIDGVPEGWRKRYNFMRYQFYKRVLYLLHRDPYKHGKGPSSWIPLLCRKLFTMNKVQQKIRNILLSCPFNTAKQVADYDDGMRFVFKKEVLGIPKTYKFEDKEVMGVADAHTYLSVKYGDYLTIPPKEKQRQHNFHFLNLNLPYRSFLANNEK